MKNKKEIMGKPRVWNERLSALTEMKVISGKHFPELLPLIRMKIEEERANLMVENARRLRKSIIGH